MATSSITKNFVISGKKQVEMFVDAIESSANNRPKRVPVAAKELTNTDDIIKLMEKRKKTNATKFGDIFRKNLKNANQLRFGNGSGV